MTKEDDCALSTVRLPSENDMVELARVGGQLDAAYAEVDALRAKLVRERNEVALRVYLIDRMLAVMAAAGVEVGEG